MWFYLALIGICIPVVGILSSTYLKAKQIEASKVPPGADPAELEKLKLENDALRQRMANLELIVSTKEWDLMLPEHQESEAEVTKKISAIATKLQKP